MCRSAITAARRSIQPSGVAVRRPNGQRKPASETEPSFGASRNLDFELELGVWIGPGNVQGEPIAIADAADHIAGFCLLNDWSARDVQGWEYQPLGPVPGQEFRDHHITLDHYPEALTPFRVAQAGASRRGSQTDALSVEWTQIRRVARSTSNSKSFWRPNNRKQKASRRTASAQVRPCISIGLWRSSSRITRSAAAISSPGDLFGSGTISGPTKDALAACSNSRPAVASR